MKNIDNRTLPSSTLIGLCLSGCLVVACNNSEEIISETDTNDPTSTDSTSGQTDSDTDTGTSIEEQEKCILEKCFDEVMTCVGDEVCNGWMECIQACGDDAMACPTFCGMYYASPLANDFTNCAVDNQCIEIDFSSFDTCRIPKAELLDLSGLQGTWWFAASSGEDHLFVPDCQRFDFETRGEHDLSVYFSVPLEDKGVEKMCGTPGIFELQPDGSVTVVYDNYAAYHEDWFILFKSANALFAHLCFASDGDGKDYGSLVLSRLPLGELSSDERAGLNAAVLEHLGKNIDELQKIRMTDCANESL